jgi:hypothetical protein
MDTRLGRPALTKKEQVKRLQKKVKKETKGAYRYETHTHAHESQSVAGNSRVVCGICYVCMCVYRELKKDSYFIADAQNKKRKRELMEKKSKWGKIMLDLQHEQQHANDMEREKKRARSRA